MKTTLGIIASLSLLIACSDNTNKEAGFKNIFNVTYGDCRKWNLPEIEFSIQYPDSIEVTFPEEGYENDNYVSLVCRDGEEDFEELTIGWLEGGSSLDFMNLGGQLLSQIESVFRTVDINAKTIFKGKGSFIDSREIYQLQMKYEVLDDSVGMDVGKYKLMLALIPNTDDQENGVLVFFQTNEENKTIRDFSDFGKVGLSGRIWNTFEFE